VFGGIAHNVIADKCHVNWETRPVVKEDGVFLNQMKLINMQMKYFYQK
jgi:acetylornithine deacetylase